MFYYAYCNKGTTWIEEFASLFLKGTAKVDLSASRFLQLHGKGIDVLDLTVLTENERLIVAAMLLNDFTVSYFQTLTNFCF